MIDAHVHCFPERMLRAIYTWFDAYGWKIAKPPDATAILDDIEGAGFGRALVLVYAHKPGISRGLNAWLRELARSDPRVLPVGCVHPGDPDLADIVREALDDFGFLGIKLHCNVGRFRADDPRFDPLWEHLRDRGRLAVVHAGTAPHADEWVGLAGAARVLDRWGGLRMQLPHLGLLEWDLALELVERHAVWLDTANVLDSRYVLGAQARSFQKRLVSAVMAHPDRIMYGSDYPILEPALGLGMERLADLELGAELTQRLLGGNAASLVAAVVG